MLCFGAVFCAGLCWFFQQGTLVFSGQLFEWYLSLYLMLNMKVNYSFTGIFAMS